MKMEACGKTMNCSKTMNCGKIWYVMAEACDSDIASEEWIGDRNMGI